MAVTTKVFENKGAVLRPFSARDSEAEGLRVGGALGMKAHALSTQRSLLHKEFLILINQHLPNLPFRLCRASDASDLMLALSGEKPASVIFYNRPQPQFRTPTRIQIGNYAPIYAKVSEPVQGTRDLVLSRDPSLLGKVDYILSVRAKAGKLSIEDFRAAGLAYGYPRSAVENYVSFSGSTAQMNEYVRLLIENNVTITPELWNAPYIPTISEGKILELEHLALWNSILAKELGQFYFEVLSAHNKLLKMELLIARSHGRMSWSEGERDRVMREAIENAYGVPLSAGY